MQHLGGPLQKVQLGALQLLRGRWRLVRGFMCVLACDVECVVDGKNRKK